MSKHGSILLVEDDPDDVYFISRAFCSSGIEVPLEVVNDGQAAIEYLLKVGAPANASDALAPCLIILDLNLPLKSGLEVLAWIRRQTDWKTVIVIVLTSSTSEADMNQAYVLGANSYVVKPSDATKLNEFGHFVKGYWFGWNQLPPACRAGQAQLRRVV